MSYKGTKSKSAGRPLERKPPPTLAPGERAKGRKGHLLTPEQSVVVPANLARMYGPNSKVEYHKVKGKLVPDRIIPARASLDKPMMEVQRLIELRGDAFFEACRLQPTDSKWYTLGIMMQASEWRGTTLAQKVRLINERTKENVSLRELRQFYVDANRDYGEIVVASNLTQLLEDTIEEATRHQVMCQNCNGAKFFEYEEWTEDGRDEDGDPLYIKEKMVKPCKVCAGEGLVWVSGDKESVDRLFNIAGYNNKPGQTSVNVGVNVNSNNEYRGIEDTSDEVSRILNVTPESVS